MLALAPRVDALPGSRAEVMAIGKRYGAKARALIGRAGIRERVTRGGAGRGDHPFRDIRRAEQGQSACSHSWSSRRRADSGGRLEVHEVFGLQLNARLVVLSACQTALGAGMLEDVPAGDDWVGLVQAFHLRARAT